MARPAASSRIDDEDARLHAPDRPRRETRSRWSRPMPRRRACGASADAPDPVFTDTLELDMCDRRAVARRSQAPAGQGDPRPRSTTQFNADLIKTYKHDEPKRVAVEGKSHDIGDGDVVIAAITSCTNTSNPSVLVAAGLVARKANALGPEAEAVGQDLAGAGVAGRHRLSRASRACRPISTRSASTWSAMAAPPASAIRARSRSRSRPRSTATTSSPPRCCRATATSRAASRRTCAPTSSPRRRWSSPMRSRAPSPRTSPPRRSARRPTAPTSI